MLPSPLLFFSHSPFCSSILGSGPHLSSLFSSLSICLRICFLFFDNFFFIPHCCFFFPIPLRLIDLKPHLASSLLLPFLFGVSCHHGLDRFKGGLEVEAPSPVFSQPRAQGHMARCRQHARHFIVSSSHDHIPESIHLYLFFPTLIVASSPDDYV